MAWPPPEYRDPPTVAEYRQRRESREESEGKIPERIIIELEQADKIDEFDEEIKSYQKEDNEFL